MSLAVAVPLGIASAFVYGTSIVVQHRAAHREGEGDTDTRGLVKLLHDPKWLLAVGGDFIGFLLQIGALATGPVILIQPLVVLMLPVALFVGYLMGGPKPRIPEYLGCVGVIGGLTLFLAMVSNPRRHHNHGRAYDLNATDATIAIVSVAAVSIVLCLGVRGRGPNLRGAVFGAAAGACFGTMGVLVNSISHQLVHRQVDLLFDHRANVIAIIGILVVGPTGIVLTQLSFQIGVLAATLPANLAADPLTAVVFGVLLLHQRVPTGPGYVCGYVVCVAAVLAGTIRLAQVEG
ncbi:MAG: DMT family transporter, partial [Actinomycetota bacterium]|nr:DMT family transporter [Actinomycetota bacterium]